ncbi:MAG: HNH endonuclease signature motif containing protein [Acidimicrobiales bacterium]
MARSTTARSSRSTGSAPSLVTRARQLLGDSILKLVITNGHDAANITHLGRGPNTAQRIALLWTSPECTVTGCVNRRIQHDHRDPWARVHETRLDNLDGLCPHHHSLKTRFRWALVAGTGKREMVPPDHPRHPDNIEPQRRSQVPAA